MAKRLEEKKALDMAVFLVLPEVYSYISQLIFAYGQPEDYPEFSKGLLEKLAVGDFWKVIKSRSFMVCVFYSF